MPELPPFLIFYVGALLALVTRGALQTALVLATPIVSGVLALTIGVDPGWTVAIAGVELQPVRVDKLSVLFGVLFHIAAFIAVVYSLHVRDTIQHVAALAYAGSALGAVFAGDLLTLFLFWEGLALSSVFLVWARRREGSFRTGLRYLVVQVLSGVLLLAGALFIFADSGSLAFSAIALEGIGPWLVLIAFGIKCGFPLLHNWIIDAYPEATETGTVFLSAFTTKVAVYALARAFAGEDLLIYIGVTMALFPIFWAVIENDLRRVLSYSMINQIGFMVCGIGLGTALAVNGAVAHAFADVIFKGLLMMSMGAVLLRTGTAKGTELGGLHKSMPWTTGFCIVGAMSISAFPLFSAFVTKSMIMSALLYQQHWILWLLMLAASAGVLEHAGIKIPWFAFFAHDSGKRPQEAPLNMRLAMAVSAVLCIGIGCFPNQLYALLPFETDYSAYDTTHVLTQLQLLFFAILGVVALHKSGYYPSEVRATNVDSDVLYRKFFPWVVRGLGRLFVPLWRGVGGAALGAGRRIGMGLFRTHGPSATLGRTWPTGSMVMWVAILLALFLLLGAIATH